MKCKLVFNKSEDRIESLHSVDQLVSWFRAWQLGDEEQWNRQILSYGVDKTLLLFDSPNELALIAAVYSEAVIDIQVIGTLNLTLAPGQDSFYIGGGAHGVDRIWLVAEESRRRSTHLTRSRHPQKRSRRLWARTLPL